MPRRLHGLACTILAVTGALLLASPLDDLLDHWLADLRHGLLRALGPSPGPAEMTVIGIGEDTYAALREPFALWHPHFGALFTALATAQARMVVLDVVLPSRRYRDYFPAGAGAVDHERTLLLGLKALRDAGADVVLGQGVQGPCPVPLSPPLMSFARDGLGLVTLTQDADGVIRRYRGAVPLPAACMPGTSGEADAPGYATLGGAAAAALGVRAGHGLIDYAIGERFRQVPLQEVLAWHQAGDAERLRREFGGRIVFIGGTTRFEDRVALPVPLAAWEPEDGLEPGVLAHAQALRTALVHGDLVRPAFIGVPLALVALAALLWLVPPRLAAGLGALAAALAALAVAGWLAAGAGRQLPVAAAALTALLAVAARWGDHGRRLHADRRRLRNAFSAYVSPNVMREIEQGRIAPGLQGERRRICVLFSDIRDFTARSEKSAPEEIIDLLNRYFEHMTEAVHRHGGTVDKFIGDGLMAFFGAPNTLPHPSRSAFAAAREMFASLERLNGELAGRGVAPLRIGVGLHTGEALVAHVGSKGRHSYTVIGDTVNLASRIEGKTKDLGCALLCSQSCAIELGGDAGLAPLGLQPIKGRSEVELFGWRPPEPATAHTGSG